MELQTEFNRGTFVVLPKFGFNWNTQLLSPFAVELPLPFVFDECIADRLRPVVGLEAVDPVFVLFDDRLTERNTAHLNVIAGRRARRRKESLDIVAVSRSDCVVPSGPLRLSREMPLP